MKKTVILCLAAMILLGMALPVSAKTVMVRENVVIMENAFAVTENYDSKIQLFSMLPEQFDLRDVSGVSLDSPVKDQGYTNSCWAFSALACTENFLRKKTYEKTGETVSFDFSERHMEHATYPDMTDGKNAYAMQYRKTDGGGNIMAAAGYFQNGLGPVAESDMPFQMMQTNPLTRGEIQKSPAARVRGLRYFPRISTSIFEYNYTELIASIKEAIYENGGVGAIINTTAGMFNDSDTAFYSEEVTGTGNHAVTLIGWDDNYSRENFGVEKPSGDGAWIVRNSAGASRHENGYFYLSYENLDSYFMCFSVTDAETSVPYDRVYGVTSGTWSYGAGYENNQNVAYAANRYQKQDTPEYLTEVSFGIRGNTAYEIYVIPDADALSLQNAVMVAKGTEPYMGYKTVTLPEPVLLTESEYAIIIRYETPGYSYSVPVYIEPFCPGITEGVSFMSADGITWTDTAENEEMVGIFGYTVDAETVSVVDFSKAETTFVTVYDENGREIRLCPDGSARLGNGTYRYVAEDKKLGIAEGSFSVDGMHDVTVTPENYILQPETNEPYILAEEISYRANLILQEYAAFTVYMGNAEEVRITYRGEDAEHEVPIVRMGNTLQVPKSFLEPLILTEKQSAELYASFLDAEGQEIGTDSIVIQFTKSSFAPLFPAIDAVISNPTQTVTQSYAVSLIAANLAMGGEIYVNEFEVIYPTERKNGYLLCDILVLDAVSGRYFRFLHDKAVPRVTQEVTWEKGYYRVNVRNNVDGIKTVNVFAEYDDSGRLLSVTVRDTAIVSSSFAYRDNGHKVKIFTLLKKDMITPCVDAYESE